MKIAMLSTGEEVLQGDIDDTNATWLSTICYEKGFSLTKRSTVGDEMGALVEELMMLSFNSDIVIVNGGLGPTTDDLTAEAAAKAAGCNLALFSEWLEILERFFESRGRQMPESNRKQAMLPEIAEIVNNPVGTACGFKMMINDALFYFTPGVPSEFKLMVETQILPDLAAQYPHVEAFDCRKLYTFGLTESGISDKLDKLELPEGFTLGYRSYLPFIEVKLFAPRSQSEMQIKVLQLICKHLESYVVSIDTPMVSNVGFLLTHKSKQLAIAEQSSAGYLSQLIHHDEKAEQYFSHGWILPKKHKQIDDEGDPLAAVFALAAVTKDKCNTDLALVTGPIEDNHFAIALAASEGEWGAHYQLSRQYSREALFQIVSVTALDLLRRYLEGKPMSTKYATMNAIKEMHIPASVLG